MDVLTRIKRLVIARHVEFTMKAELERLRDGLMVEDVLESVVNANAVKKTLRSRSAGRGESGERLYVIESPNFSGVWIYTKGAIRKKGRQEVFLCLRLVEALRVEPGRRRLDVRAAEATGSGRS